MLLRRAVFAAEEFVCGIVAGNDSPRGIVCERADTGLHREIREDAARRGDVTLLDVGDGLAATPLPRRLCNRTREWE